MAPLPAMWLDGQFRDPGDNDHRAPVFAVTPTKVLAFGKAPYSQTRYTFTTGADLVR